MDPSSLEYKKSLDQLLGQALAERSREEEQVEVTYELGDDFTFYEKQHRLQPSSGPSRTPSLKEDGDEENTEPLGSIELESKVMRSTIILSTAIVLCFNGFHMLQSLQSSIFPHTGVNTLFAIYCCAALSCIFAPAATHQFKFQWTAITFGVTSCLYLLSFYFYNDYCFVLSGILLGSSFGPMFCASMTYVSLNVSRLPYITQVMRDKTQQRFLKLFCIVAKSSFFWGNLIASLVMHFSVESVPLISSSNATGATEILTSTYDLCFKVQLKNSLQDLSKTDGYFSEEGVVIQFNTLHHSSVRVLVLVFASSVVAGVLLMVAFLEKIELLLPQDPMERPLFLQTLRQIRLVLFDKKIRLSIPLIIFIGIEQGFIFADFTRGYVSCSLGLPSVVFTMMCLGGCNTLGCIAVHTFSEHIQRTIIMAAGFVCQSGLLMVLYLWTPMQDDAAVFYVIAGGWGLCNAVWETLIITYFAATYIDDWQVPFTTQYLLQCVGMSLSFSVSNVLGSDIKVCVLTAALAVAIVPYTILEFRIHHRNTVHNRTSML